LLLLLLPESTVRDDLGVVVVWIVRENSTFHKLEFQNRESTPKIRLKIKSFPLPLVPSCVSAWTSLLDVRCFSPSPKRCYCAPTGYPWLADT
jgi:hypothetical protein